VSAETQYSLFVKILTFDRTLQREDLQKIVIGVLYQDGIRISVQTKDDFVSAVQQSGVKQILGKPIECIPIAINGSSWPEALENRGVEILYVTPVRAFDIESLADRMSTEKVLTLTGVPDYVNDGIAIGIGTRGEKPTILINLDRAKKQGADLSAQLLRLATMVE